MDHIIDMYDDKYYESQEDALDNAMALRRCAKKVARILDCNVKDLLDVEWDWSEDMKQRILGSQNLTYHSAVTPRSSHL